MRLLPAMPLTLLFATIGCGISPQNPSFKLAPGDARAALKEMKQTPKPLDRPLVVIGGYLDFGLGPAFVRHHLEPVVDDDRIVSITLFTCADFESCRRRIVDAVNKRFPSDDPTRTVEVDVVGISMGGLAARYAATESPGERRLNIARLFTLSSPHRGAQLALMPTLHPIVYQIREDSKFHRDLDGTSHEYPIYPYVRLGDLTVGPQHAAPAGQLPYWVPNEPFQSAHMGGITDPRILADIARRLRGEPPFAEEPVPLPS